MKKLLLYILLAGSLSTFAQWQQTNGPFGGKVYSIFIKGNRIYAGTEAGGIYVSTDAANTWTSSSVGLQTSNTIFKIAAYDTILIAASLGKGVFISPDSGSSWTPANIGITNLNTRSITSFGKNIFIGTEDGVYLSTDYTNVWNQVNNGLTNTNIWDITNKNNKLFAATNGGVFLSTDSGSTWVAKNNGLTDLFIKQIKSVGTDIFVATNSGIFRSTDDGDNWVAVNNSFFNAPNYVYRLAAEGSTIFAGTDIGLFVSTDLGANWTPISNGLDNSLIISITTDGATIYVGTLGSSLYKSINNGLNWTEKNIGLKNNNISDMAVSGNYLITGTEESGIFYSIDTGNTWIAANNGLLNKKVNSLAVNGTNWFAATESGLFSSSDNGNSWSLLNNGIPSNQFISRLNYVGTNLFASTWFGLYRSNDKGNSWTQLNNKNYFSTAAIGNNLFVANEGDSILVSNDLGDNFTFVSNQLATLGVSVLKAHNNQLFAGSYSFGVYRSFDNGVTWNTFSNALSSHYIGIIYGFKNVLFACSYTDGGIYMSNDTARTWQNISNSIPNVYNNCIASIGNKLLSGTLGNSVYKASLNNNQINGTITESIGSVNSGFVKLYSYDNGSKMAKIDSVQVDASGNYTFNDVLTGNYLIYANCEAGYPNTIPTYYDSIPTWDSANVVSVSFSSNITANIALVETATLTGKGSIMGYVYKGLNYGKLLTPGDPISGVDVNVGRKPKSHANVVKHTRTDANGKYEVQNLEIGDYVIYVDIPGLPMDSSYTVSITATDTVFNNLDYFVDSTNIYLIPSAVGIVSKKQNSTNTVSIYPNPASKNAFIKLDIKETGKVKFALFNSMGALLTEKEEELLSASTYTYSLQLPTKGVYFVQITINGKVESLPIYCSE